MPLRVGVYAIAKDEAKYVTTWAASAVDADVRLLVDTGSTDGTVELARAAGVTVHTVHVRPWRFDVARNAALALLPDDLDYCIALDLDEVLQPGWRAALEQAHAQGLTRPRYRYVWSWLADGSEGLVYHGDKIHTRHGYRWRCPVHETLAPSDPTAERVGVVPMAIHHHPDGVKSRASYLPLLKLAVEESPADDRLAHYYARELYYAGNTEPAIREFQRHLALPSATWRPERAASMGYLARLTHENPALAESWALRACAEAPERREPWVVLAELRHARKDWPGCYAAATRATAITERPLEYLCDPSAWGALPHDLLAVSGFNLARGLGETVRTHGRLAAHMAPTDKRLQENLVHYGA